MSRVALAHPALQGLSPVAVAASVAPGKAAARAAGEAAARGLQAPLRARFAAGLADALASLAARLDARTIGLYAPIGAEVDTRQLANRLLADGRSLAYPRLSPEPGLMEFAASAGPTALRARPRSRILEPEGSQLDADALDLLVVPALAADGGLRRVGRAGGYYDRYLLRVRADCVVVLVLPSAAVVPWSPVEPHDAAGDAVCTERGLFGPAGGA